MDKVEITIEDTPNPGSKKFVFNTTISDRTIEFRESLDAGNSPLAMKIFGFPWAESVMIGPNFVAVNKQDWVDWEIIQEPLAQILLEHVQSNEPIIKQDLDDSLDENSVLEDDSEEVKLIKNILNNHIRPAVMMDGGDVIFKKYEDRILYLDLIGACSGCPSSSATLKGGVERVLKKHIPDIAGVVAI